jgi:hypothetical protein
MNLARKDTRLLLASFFALRYEFYTHALLVLAFLNFLHQFRAVPRFVRVLGMGVVALACIAGLSVRARYIWNFTRGNWVA